MSDNYVVQIIDAIAEKFGMVIDWSSQNVVPYIQELMARIVQYEIGVNVFWLIFVPVMTAAFGLAGMFMINRARKEDKYDWEDTFLGIAGIISTAICICGIIATCIVVPCCVIHIVECNTIPEKIFIELITNFMN